MVTWVLFLGVGLIIGVIAGLYFARLDDVSNRQKKKLQEQLDQAQSELGEYKTQVTEHFLQTSVLINQMSDSYKAVHAHLAEGANSLCDSHVNVNQLEVGESRLIKAASETESPVEINQTSETDLGINAEEPVVAASVDSPSSEPAAPAEETSAATEESVEASKDVQSQTTEAQPVEPPSTPESLPLDDKDVDSEAAKLSESDKSSAPYNSRMVH